MNLEEGWLSPSKFIIQDEALKGDQGLHKVAKE